MAFLDPKVKLELLYERIAISDMQKGVYDYKYDYLAEKPYALCKGIDNINCQGRYTLLPVQVDKYFNWYRQILSIVCLDIYTILSVQLESQCNLLRVNTLWKHAKKDIKGNLYTLYNLSWWIYNVRQIHNVTYLGRITS